VRKADEFTRFEYEGWQRVAEKYDAVWSSLTRQFIPYLIDAAQVSTGLSVLDVACGPGYVSAAVEKVGANPTGVDFSKKMIAIASSMFPEIAFREGDAQQLRFADASYDRVLMNFGLLHLSSPEKACAEAFRVLRPRGKFGFTIWAEPHENPGGKIVNDAIEAHADLNVDVPEGPSKFLYANKQECRKALERDGFQGESIIFETHLVEWDVPTPRYLFEAERDAGVRTAGLLAHQASDQLEAIMRAIEVRVRRYAKGNRFAIPMAAHIVVASKR
jgi:ubiquinone/menaquinone biosynthesis C-methylase UbiE